MRPFDFNCQCGSMVKRQSYPGHKNSNRHLRWISTGSIIGESAHMCKHIYNESCRIKLPCSVLRDLMADLDVFSCWFMLLHYSLPIHNDKKAPLDDSKTYLTGVVYDFLTTCYNETIFFELPLNIQNKIHMANSIRRSHPHTLDASSNSLHDSLVNQYFSIPEHVQQPIIDSVFIFMDNTPLEIHKPQTGLTVMDSFPGEIILNHYRIDCTKNNSCMKCSVCLCEESELNDDNMFVVISCGHYLCLKCKNNIKTAICPECRHDTSGLTV